jgi:hypothetical protein
MGLIERIVGAAKAALKPALRTTAVSGEELQTVIAKTMGILNNFPIAYTIHSDVDFHYRPLTPNHFLTGQPSAELQVDSDGKGKFTVAKRYKQELNSSETRCN